VIVDIGVYEDGVRMPGGGSASEVAALAAERPGRFSWVGLAEPTADELKEIAELWGLHPLAVEDAIHAHQRPKLDRYGEAIFVVLKTARYVDREEVFEFGEVMLFVDATSVITVRHGAGCDLPAIRHLLEADAVRLANGPSEVLLAIADHIVDGYEATLAAVEDDIDEIQVDVFTGPSSRHAERIFKLKREVLQFRQAVLPLADPTSALSTLHLAAIPADRRAYFANVHDHVVRAGGRVEAIDTLLDGALHANVAQVGMRQNEDMRKISAWVAIVSVPTMIAGIYGMNFEHMPELGSVFGYPAALGLIVVACVALHRNFKRRDWL
jgi:magnesium transporter